MISRRVMLERWAGEEEDDDDESRLLLKTAPNVRPARLLLFSWLTLRKSARFGVSILSSNINLLRLVLLSI